MIAYGIVHRLIPMGYDFFCYLCGATDADRVVCAFITDSQAKHT